MSAVSSFPQGFLGQPHFVPIMSPPPPPVIPVGLQFPFSPPVTPSHVPVSLATPSAASSFVPRKHYLLRQLYAPGRLALDRRKIVCTSYIAIFWCNYDCGLFVAAVPMVPVPVLSPVPNTSVASLIPAQPVSSKNLAQHNNCYTYCHTALRLHFNL